MKEGIHPAYVPAIITCACGETVHTRSTKPTIRLDICSKCHPFFSGKHKFVDTAGRIERFQRKYKKQATPPPALSAEGGSTRRVDRPVGPKSGGGAKGAAES